ncbi:ubiquitinyl hydrolase 1 [Caenorhabditis elegans]|nr:USP domain-containing protein [Caenorhabditis elegans]CDH93265.1 USP domain-containing protein [Caenorhabditis elegans]|eukprot:NP_001293464.1 Deubiquitylating with USP/UBP and OTU domains [Caenorhabditis elegans]
MVNLQHTLTPSPYASSTPKHTPTNQMDRSKISFVIKPQINLKNCSRELLSPKSSIFSSSPKPKETSPFYKTTPTKTFSSTPKNLKLENLKSPEDIKSPPPIKKNFVATPSTSKSTASYSYSRETPKRETPARETPSYWNQEVKYPNRRLYNTGNSCYFNSTMQALSSCPSLVSRFEMLHRLRHGNYLECPSYDLRPKFAVFESCLRMMVKLSDRMENPHLKEYRLPSFSETELANTRLKIGRVVKEFDNNDQKDAHEYLTELLSCVDDIMQVVPDEIKHLDPLNSIRYKTERSFICFNCGHEEKSSDCGWILPLSISNNDYGIIELLESNFKTTLETNKICSSCSCENAVSSERIANFPECLILNPMRYERTSISDYRKDNRQITVPLTLDLTRFGAFASLEQDENRNSVSFGSCGKDSIKYRNGPSIGPRLLSLNGGSLDDEEIDIEMMKEVVKNPLHFKWLTDLDEIEQMLKLTNITYRRDDVKIHVEKLENEKSVVMKKFDRPGRVKGIESDGNCFYRAISWCLTGSQKYHKALRIATANYLRNDIAIVDKYCHKTDHKTYVQQVEGDGWWATNVEICVMANLLNVNIYTFLSDGWICTSPQNSSTSRSGSFYLENKDCHYEPVLSLKKDDSLRSRKRRNTDTEYTDDNEGGGFKKRKPDDDASRKPRNLSESERRRQPPRDAEDNGNHYKKMNANTDQIAKYRLFAAICHIGEFPDRGHYLALTRDLYNPSKWLDCSDAVVRDISSGDVIKDASSSGYLLFYDRQ